MIGPRTIIAVLAAVVVFGLFVFACWAGGWWLFAQSVNKQAHINTSSYGAQVSDISLISADMQDIYGDQHDLLTAPSGLAQQIRTEILGTANAVCHEDTLLTGTVPLDSQTAAFISTNCAGGSVTATSTLRNGT